MKEASGENAPIVSEKSNDDDRILQARALRLSSKEKRKISKKNATFIAFEACNTQYLIRSEVMSEVVKGGAVTLLPGPMDGLIGLVGVQGRVLPVIDLGHFVGRESDIKPDRDSDTGAGQAPYLIVLQSGAQKVCLIAQQLVGETTIAEDDVLNMTDDLAAGNSLEVAVTDDGRVLLDTRHLFDTISAR